MAQSISRRSFVTGMAASAAAGCTLAAGTAAADQPAAPQTADQQVPWSFEIAPDPVDESLISDTIEADVVVIGSGPSGLVTALSCLQNGVDVVLFSASSRPMGRGGSHQAFGSSYQKEMGIDYDPTAEAMKRTVRMEQHGASYMTDQKKWSRWIANSGASTDWMIDIMRSHGLSLMLEPGYDDPEGLLTTPPSSHCFYTDEMPMGPVTGAPLASQAFADEYTAAGGMLHYDTVAKYLEREDGGRVSAAVAQRADGTYVRYVGRKAVVLATGDFSANRDMMYRYAPSYAPYIADEVYDSEPNYDAGFQYGGLFKGDGQRMGLWVGAGWQKIFPNCVMGGFFGPGPRNLYSNFLGLLVNTKGERFMNENCLSPCAGMNNFGQPGKTVFALWGHDYASQVELSGSWNNDSMLEGDPAAKAAAIVESWDADVEAGAMVKGDTLESVIEQLGLPPETIETVNHYNELCLAGEDTDYHKDPSCLHAFGDGPYYGQSSGGMLIFLTVLGGLSTDPQMRVCDKEDNPIPGLYNVGTMVGDMFATNYTFMVEGANYGANCITFGYLTGKHIAENE